MKEIGPDLDEEVGKYWSGVRAKNGSIYCVPNRTKQHFLKITQILGLNRWLVNANKAILYMTVVVLF